MPKRKKNFKLRSNKNEPDEKKIKLEDVPKSIFSWHHFVNMSVDKSFEVIGKKAVDTVKNLNKQGKLFFCYS